MSLMPLKELRASLGAVHSKKLCKTLTLLGIPYRMVAGNPRVLRTAFEAAFGASTTIGKAAGLNITARLARLKETPHGKKTAQQRRAA